MSIGRRLPVCIIILGLAVLTLGGGIAPVVDPGGDPTRAPADP